MGKGNDPAESPSTELKYCYGHGYQKSHNSADCKLLAGDKKKFTAEMRRATGPNHPPGGSTKINGQTAPQKPKTVTANMVHQLEPTSNDDSFDEQSDDGLDETEAFLSGILEDYKTEEATAMMMDDALLLDDMTPDSTGQVLPPHEVPRSSLDENLGHKMARSAAPPPKSTPAIQQELGEAPFPYVLITDGSQFRARTGPSLPFWEAELDALQNSFRAKFAQQPHIEPPSRRIPTVDELQVEFITWLLDQPLLPLQVSPASSGFYSVVYGCPVLRSNSQITSDLGAMEGSHKTPYEPSGAKMEQSDLGAMEGSGKTPYEPSGATMEQSSSVATGFFDDEYVGGKRAALLSRDVSGSPLNPAQRASPTYHDVFSAELTTISQIERHEERIYQPGYTPTAIRANITAMLRNMGQDQHMVDFQDKDIPPPTRDPQTHKILTGLLHKRNRLDRDFQLPTASVAADGTSLQTGQYEQEYLRRDKEYNRLNRGMYHVYAASAYIVHDRNFLSYCRPSLRNLPESTAYKLETLKAQLRPPQAQLKTTKAHPRPLDPAGPPYQTIHNPTPTQTKPIFSGPKPAYSDVLRGPALKPRATWMRDEPPFMSEEQADQVWRQSNDAMFGRTSPTTLELEQHIKNLRKMLNERTQKALPLPQRHDKDTLSEG